MTRKKVIILIVEGVSDERALSSLSRLVKEIHDVYIHITLGDVFTKNTDKPVKAVIGDEITKVMNIQKFMQQDILAVVQVTDTDGVFIDDTLVTVDSTLGDDIRYTENGILVPSEDKARLIKERNREKSKVLRMMSSSSKIKRFKYTLLYFSCNLDHVIHCDCNLPEEEKTPKAREFSSRFRGRSYDFRDFFVSGSFAVNGDLAESWKFIQENNNSIQRYSNFQLVFELLDKIIEKG